MKVCVTGGGGYVGSVLVPKLLAHGHEVTVLDTFWFGDTLPQHPRLTRVIGDIRNMPDLLLAFEKQFAVIHLACISNDPSFDMNPELGKQVNWLCLEKVLGAVKRSRVSKFIYASSSSVYGVSELASVTEGSPKKPLTDYSKFKLMCEEALIAQGPGFPHWTILRPATVCGYAPRLRLDLVVNILTTQALVNKKITLFGREQKRPNINVQDMADAYLWALESSPVLTDRKIYNVGYENHSLIDIAEMIKKELGGEIEIAFQPTNDHRSYHVNSDAISRAGFKPKHTVQDAIRSLALAWRTGRMEDPLNNTIFHNIKRMKELNVV